MDIERMKKLLTSGIEAGNKVKAVRTWSHQDLQDTKTRYV